MFQEETAVIGMPRLPGSPLSTEPRGIGHPSGSSAAGAAAGAGAAAWPTLSPGSEFLLSICCLFGSLGHWHAVQGCVHE